jgi:hypothetical protein
MPDRQFYTKECAVAKAKDIQTALATSKLRLFKAPDLVPTTFTTRAELEAAECDFSGYTAGGYPLPVWTGPANNPGGGQALTSPLIHPAVDGAADPIIPNSVGGWWVEDKTAVSPQVRVVGVFDPPRSMSTPGDMIDWVDQIIEGLNPLV